MVVIFIRFFHYDVEHNKVDFYLARLMSFSFTFSFIWNMTVFAIFNKKVSYPLIQISLPFHGRLAMKSKAVGATNYDFVW